MYCGNCKFYKNDNRTTTPCTGFCLSGPPVERFAGVYSGKFMPRETKASWVCGEWEGIKEDEYTIDDE